VRVLFPVVRVFDVLFECCCFPIILFSGCLVFHVWYIDVKIFDVKIYNVVVLMDFQFCFVMCEVCRVSDVVVVNKCNVLV
jgi:hypothetical protein